MVDVQQTNLRFGPSQKARLLAAAKAIRVSAQQIMRAGTMRLVDEIEATTDPAGRLGLAARIDGEGERE
jgi:hypothetical protein